MNEKVFTFFFADKKKKSVEQEKLKQFKQAGVNRLSLGIQTFNNRDLKLLGRDHSTKEALKALSSAKDIFEKVSFDLIYARPGQTIEGILVKIAQRTVSQLLSVDWRKELKVNNFIAILL